MPRHAPLAALLAALLLAPGALHAAGFGGLGVDTSDFGFALPSLNTGEDIQISADRMGADRETQRVTLDGNVRIRFADLTLTSHHASYNRATGDLYAEGDVRIVSAAGGVWEGDSIAFNHRTGEGLMGTGLLRLGSFAVSAPGGASRDDDGVLHARNATLTTCTNEPSAWHWSVTGTGRYKDKEFIELRNATMRLFHVPFLWAPYYYRDLNTHYGWRILPGYTGDWGAYLRLGYVYPIAGNRESDRELYGKTILDLRSERGVSGIVQLRSVRYGADRFSRFRAISRKKRLPQCSAISRCIASSTASDSSGPPVSIRLRSSRSSDVGMCGSASRRSCGSIRLRQSKSSAISSGEGETTRSPRFGSGSISPSAVRRRNASRSGVRLIPNSAARTSSVRRVPAGYRPPMIRSASSR